MNVFGKGGHSKVVANSIKELGIVCDDYDIENYSESELNANWIIAIGDNHVRKRVSEKLSKYSFSNVVAPSSVINILLRHIVGSFFANGSIVHPGSTIGNHVIINTNASVDHDCVIEDYVHVAPGSTLCGWVHVGECTLIGAGSVVLPNVKIGKNCIIGAGSVVTKDIPDDSTVYGNPAKIQK